MLSYNFLKGGCSFYYRDIFSGLSNEKMSPALYFSPSRNAMDKNTSSLPNIPKRSLDNLLHYLTMQEIKKTKKNSVTPQKKHPHFLYQYYKGFKMISRLKGSALCLLKTKFAIKPRNPE